MIPLLLNCANSQGQQITDWKRILRNNLSEGFEVQLNLVNFDYDEPFCREIAQEFSRVLIKTEEGRSAFFAKVHPPQRET